MTVTDLRDLSRRNTKVSERNVALELARAVAAPYAARDIRATMEQRPSADPAARFSQAALHRVENYAALARVAAGS